MVDCKGVNKLQSACESVTVLLWQHISKANYEQLKGLYKV